MGRYALVTGGNTGIGLATCRVLAEHGCTVLLGSRSRERGAAAVHALCAEGLDVQLQQIDVVDDGSVQTAADDIAQRIGHLDILVNNAGIMEEVSPAVPSMTALDVVQRTLDTNVIGTIRVIHAMLPLLRSAPAGRIVNISSGLGSLTRCSDPTRLEQRVPLLAYATSKTAVNALTVQFANELAGTTVKINAVDPGPVHTPMNPRARRTPEQSVAPIVAMALLDADGPNGVFIDEDGVVPW